MSQNPTVPTFIFRGHNTAVHGLHFFQNNTYLASGDGDGWIIVWSLATKRPVAVWKAHDGGVMAIQDWEGDRLLSHGRDHFLRVWQFRAEHVEGFDIRLPVDGALPNENKQPWLLHSMAANALNYCAFTKCKEFPSSDHNSEKDQYAPLLVTTPNGLDAGGVDIFQLPSQHRVCKIPSESDAQNGMVMSLSMFHHPTLNQLVLIAGFENGQIIVSLRESATPEMWTWKTRMTCQPHSQPVLSLDTTPDYQYFVSSSADAIIAKTMMPKSIVQQYTADKVVDTKHAGQQDITIRDDGKIFATAGWDKRVRVYSVKTLKELAVLVWHQDGCYAVAFALTNMTDDTKTDNAASKENAMIRTASDLVKDERSKKAQETHWLAAGGKDGKVSLWNIY